MNEKLCYGLLETEMLNPFLTHVTPIIIKEGEKGYYRTNWSWIKEYAREALDSCNTRLGITKEESYKMMIRSMFS